MPGMAWRSFYHEHGNVNHRALARHAVPVALLLAGTSFRLSAQQKCPAVTGGTMPLTYSGGPTVADITACDLMTRLYIYAADSMRGREAGTPDAIRATAYIESEVRRLGLKPAGDHGTYFEYLPVTARVLGAGSSIMSGSSTFKPNEDFSITGLGADRKVSGDVIFASSLADTANALTADQVRGKVLIATGGAGGRGFGGGGRGGFGGLNALSGAAAILTVVPVITPARPAFTLNDTVQSEGRAAYAAANPNAGRGGRGGRGGGGGQLPLTGTITSAVASALLGKSVQSAARGDAGGSATIDVHVET